jgi:MOSC domain-containing protein YiiM
VEADTGVVVGLHRSAGGVPKRPVPQVTIGRRGLDGDRQATRKHHGRPWQALCLWSIEVIDRLREEGHPIGPGCAGENITIQGIDWAALRVGTRLRIGPVLAEVSAHSTPCVKNARWFEGGDFHRIDHNAHPGWSRLYASVIDTGTVSDGDDVVVEP